MSQTSQVPDHDQESATAGRGRWLLSNGPGVITVLGAAIVGILASVVGFTAVQLLQIVLLLMALIATSLITERLVEGRRDRERLASISSKLDTVVSFTRNENVSVGDVVVSRRQLPPLEDRQARLIYRPGRAVHPRAARPRPADPAYRQ